MLVLSDELDLDTRSQRIGRGKQYINYGIQTAHARRLMHGIDAHVPFDDLDLVIDLKTFVRLVLLAKTIKFEGGI